MELNFEVPPDQGEAPFRIRATKNIPRHRVKAGDVGGWISSTHTSSGVPRISGDAWVGGNALVTGDAIVTENALVKGNARIQDAAVISGSAVVRGSARVIGEAEVSAQACVQGNATIGGRSCIGGRAHIHGNARIFGPLIAGRAHCCDTAEIMGSAQIIGESEIASRGHCVVVENFILGGDSPVTLWRHRNGYPQLQHDDWVGSPTEFLQHLQNYSATTGSEDLERQVDALLLLVRTYADSWSQGMVTRPATASVSARNTLATTVVDYWAKAEG